MNPTTNNFINEIISTLNDSLTRKQTTHEANNSHYFSIIHFQIRRKSHFVGQRNTITIYKYVEKQIQMSTFKLHFPIAMH